MWSDASERMDRRLWHRLNQEKQTHPVEVYSACEMKGGADDGTKLEPSALASLLEELEDWGEVLKSEPEVIHKLRAFEAAASEKSKSKKTAPRANKRPAGPSL